MAIEKYCDGYVIDHTIKDVRKPHRCDTCGHLTTNIRECLATGEVSEDLCDACLYEFYPHVNW